MATKPLRWLDALDLVGTTPRHQAMADMLAAQMALLSPDEIAQLLRVNAKIATTNYARYQQFHAEDTPELLAVAAYTGIVFKYLDAKSLDMDTWHYAQNHLRITSFLYGLLRPLDAIRAYRLEGDVQLPGVDDNVFAHWRDTLTPLFLEDLAAAGGRLCYLASDEMHHLFHWRAIEEQAKAIYTPEFYVLEDGKLKTKVVYIKMARGTMARYILQQRITTREELEAFTFDGFAYNDKYSTEHRLIYTLEV